MGNKHRLDQTLVKIANGIHSQIGAPSRMAHALDQLETFVLHNRADIEWTDDGDSAASETVNFVNRALKVVLELN